MALCTRSLLARAANKSFAKKLGGNLACISLSGIRKYGSAESPESASASFRHGFVMLSMPLPSRNELCEFALKPVSHSVKDVIQFIKDEDGGVERAAIYSPDGKRISQSTPVEILMQRDFKIVINEKEFDVIPPEEDLLSAEASDHFSQLRNLVEKLHTELNVQQYQEKREDQIKQTLEHLQASLEPLEESKAMLDAKAAKRTNFLVWGGLAYMAAQFGFLARLTWWEYSWDIMEPVTYFVTYGSSIAMYAYFVLTREEYTYNYARDREHLIRFHKEADSQKFDLSKYNYLKESIAKLQTELAYLKKPQLNLSLNKDVVE